MTKKKYTPHIESALIKLGQDQDLLDSVIQVIVQQWPTDEKMMKKAFAEKNFEQMRKSFHTLSGSVSYFSFDLSKAFHDLSDRAGDRMPISEQQLKSVIKELDGLISELAAWQRARRSA